MRAARTAFPRYKSPEKEETNKRTNEKEKKERRSINEGDVRARRSERREGSTHTRSHRSARGGSCRSRSADGPGRRWAPRAGVPCRSFREIASPVPIPYSRAIPLLVVTRWPNVAGPDRRDISIVRSRESPRSTFSPSCPSLLLSLAPFSSFPSSEADCPRVTRPEEHSRRSSERLEIAIDRSRSGAIGPRCLSPVLAAGVADTDRERKARLSWRAAFPPPSSGTPLKGELRCAR